MKTTLMISAAMTLAAASAVFAGLPAEYTVHEWGTFTSFQGADGRLQAWNPVQTAELPGFVYSTRQFAPAYRLGTVMQVVNGFKGGVGGMITLQRMETPVMYFYPASRMQVNVSVDFPQGLITEWYPQVTAFGPLLPVGTNAHTITALSQSGAQWRNLELIPDTAASAAQLIQDTKGTHYFAARATASALLQKNRPAGDQRPPEQEKFIFYRGAGNFRTPLQVNVSDANQVVVKNNGQYKLPRLFLVSIHGKGKDKTGACAALDTLSPGQTVTWKDLTSMMAAFDHQTFDQFQENIASQMTNALVAAGLYPDEATAMVNTWKDSWFSEEGDRVLYILPRAWTDQTLPLILDPVPQKLVRVMVGRSEILSPALQNDLRNNLTRAAKGDAAARQSAVNELQSLGRFAMPALALVNAGNANASAVELSYQLVLQAARPTAPSNFE